VDVQEIEVIIEKNGQVRVQVRGVKGQGCLDLTAALEQALGGQIEAREMTAEAYEQVGERVREQQWNRGG
jgi:hypothetical protein